VLKKARDLDGRDEQGKLKWDFGAETGGEDIALDGGGLHIAEPLNFVFGEVGGDGIGEVGVPARKRERLRRNDTNASVFSLARANEEMVDSEGGFNGEEMEAGIGGWRDDQVVSCAGRKEALGKSSGVFQGSEDRQGVCTVKGGKMRLHPESNDDVIGGEGADCGINGAFIAVDAKDLAPNDLNAEFLEGLEGRKSDGIGLFEAVENIQESPGGLGFKISVDDDELGVSASGLEGDRHSSARDARPKNRHFWSSGSHLFLLLG